MMLPQRALEPIERISEVLFGLIMVLTATGTLSVVNAGNPEIKTMILGALGCNLAWGIIDGGLYLLGRIEDHGRNLKTLRGVKQAAEPDAVRHVIADALPEPIAASLAPEDLDLIARKLSELPEVAETPRDCSRGLGGCSRCLSVGILFDDPRRRPVSVRQRRPARVAYLQHRCNRAPVRLRLRLRPQQRSLAVADRPDHGVRWHGFERHRYRTRRLMSG